MAVVVPPMPLKNQIIDKNGYMTDAWIKWFRQVFERIGGLSALSNTQLAAGLGGDVDTRLTNAENSISALQVTSTTHTTQISTINTTLSGHTSQITQLQNDLNGLRQGPALWV